MNLAIELMEKSEANDGDDAYHFYGPEKDCSGDEITVWHVVLYK